MGRGIRTNNRLLVRNNIGKDGYDIFKTWTKTSRRREFISSKNIHKSDGAVAGGSR